MVIYRFYLLGVLSWFYIVQHLVLTPFHGVALYTVNKLIHCDYFFFIVLCSLQLKANI